MEQADPGKGHMKMFDIKLLLNVSEQCPTSVRLEISTENDRDHSCKKKKKKIVF